MPPILMVANRCSRCAVSNKAAEFQSIDGQAGMQEKQFMSDAQVGLVMATPLIVIFAVMLHRMGVLRLSGTIAAVTMSIAIATALFLTQ